MKSVQLVRVFLWMTGALTSFSALAVSARELARTLSLFEVLTIRSVCGLIVLGAIGLARPQLFASVSFRRFGANITRSAFHFAGQLGWVWALTLLPLATVFALEFTMPALVALLAPFMLGERLTRARIVTVLLGFIGVVIILRPGMEAFQPAALVVIAAAFGYAIFYTMTKGLTATETPFSILFWMNVLQLPMGLAGSDPLFFAKIPTDQIPLALILGLTALSAHWCFAKAFQSGDAMVVVPVDFLRVPLIAMVGAFLYAERLDPFVFLGAGVILTGILVNLRAETRRPAG